MSTGCKKGLICLTKQTRTSTATSPCTCGSVVVVTRVATINCVCIWVLTAINAPSVNSHMTYVKIVSRSIFL